jgi:orotidine-5'-phosphate decarboxylase
VVRELQGIGFEIFLDLKFHDIPNTTAKACAMAAELGVWMVNVHASGGRAMMERCVEELSTFGDDRPRLIGVTVLTSLSGAELKEIGVLRSPNEQVLLLAQLAQSCGLDGVVCSAQEAHLLRRNMNAPFLLVTPGIRPNASDSNDQKRIATPTKALVSGANYLVIGRPITQAENPKLALLDINNEIQLIGH